MNCSPAPTILGPLLKQTSAASTRQEPHAAESWRGLEQFSGGVIGLHHKNHHNILIKGEKVESFVWIPFELVTAENYKEYLKR